MALMNWGPLLKLAFPSMAMILSEWTALEVNRIIAGYALIDELDIFSILYQLSGVLWGMASGVFVEAAELVGNALGQRKPQFGRQCVLMCLGLTVTFVIVNLSVTLLLQSFILTLFTGNTEGRTLFRKMLSLYARYHIFDCNQSCMMGVLCVCSL